MEQVSRDVIQRLKDKGLLRFPEPPELKDSRRFSRDILEAIRVVRESKVVQRLKPAPKPPVRKMCRHCGRRVGHTALCPHRKA